ncbi:hypothetical protein D3C87_1021760 [compost metagenome]
MAAPKNSKHKQKVKRKRLQTQAAPIMQKLLGHQVRHNPPGNAIFEAGDPIEFMSMDGSHGVEPKIRHKGIVVSSIPGGAMHLVVNNIDVYVDYAVKVRHFFLKSLIGLDNVSIRLALFDMNRVAKEIPATPI